MINQARLFLLWFSLLVFGGLSGQSLSAQTVNNAPALTTPLSQRLIPALPPQDIIPRPPQTSPPQPTIPPQLPPPGELLQPGTPTTPNPEPPSENVPETITVKRFDVIRRRILQFLGSTCRQYYLLCFAVLKPTVNSEFASGKGGMWDRCVPEQKLRASLWAQA